jgi:hypothetical protein
MLNEEGENILKYITDLGGELIIPLPFEISVETNLALGNGASVYVKNDKVISEEELTIALEEVAECTSKDTYNFICTSLIGSESLGMLSYTLKI